MARGGLGGRGPPQLKNSPPYSEKFLSKGLSPFSPVVIGDWRRMARSVASLTEGHKVVVIISKLLHLCFVASALNRPDVMDLFGRGNAPFRETILANRIGKELFSAEFLPFPAIDKPHVDGMLLRLLVSKKFLYHATPPFAQTDHRQTQQADHPKRGRQTYPLFPRME